MSPASRQQCPTNPGAVPRLWAVGILLAAIPVLSFLLQYWFSSRNNTLPLLLRHYTVSYIDWVFVPFNLVAIYAIDWRRGGLLFLLAILSIVLNVVTHAYWQQAVAVNPGHMFSAQRLLLGAGWVHLCYSSIQMALLLAYVFVRRPASRACGFLSALCFVYFISAGISGYVMNKGFMITDAAMVLLGLGFTFIYPRFAYRVTKPASDADASDAVATLRGEP